MAKITYNNKSDINTSTTPVQNKVSADDMNEIKSVVNDNDDLMGDLTTLMTIDKTSIVKAINELVGRAVYSTTEKVVGIWKDGKPIYEKTYQHTGGNSGTAITENITINDDVKMFTYYEVLATNSSTPANSLKAQYYNDANDFFRFFTTNATTLSYRYKLAWQPIIYTTIRYTKTTD